MTWTITFHETKPTEPKVGDCWLNPEMIEGDNAEWYKQNYLSDQYMRDHLTRRAPLIVVLPAPKNGRNWFCVDARASGSGTSGWTVTGEPHALTVTPSINIVGEYHGFITAGTITADCEGRRYEP